GSSGRVAGDTIRRPHLYRILPGGTGAGDDEFRPAPELTAAVLRHVDPDSSRRCGRDTGRHHVAVGQAVRTATRARIRTRPARHGPLRDDDEACRGIRTHYDRLAMDVRGTGMPADPDRVAADALESAQPRGGKRARGGFTNRLEYIG